MPEWQVTLHSKLLMPQHPMKLVLEPVTKQVLQPMPEPMPEQLHLPKMSQRLIAVQQVPPLAMASLQQPLTPKLQPVATITTSKQLPTNYLQLLHLFQQEKFVIHR